MELCRLWKKLDRLFSIVRSLQSKQTASRSAGLQVDETVIRYGLVSQEERDYKSKPLRVARMADQHWGAALIQKDTSCLTCCTLPSPRRTCKLTRPRRMYGM